MCDAANEIFVMGREEGREEGRVEAQQSTARKLHSRGMSVPEIADFLEVSQEQVKLWLDLKSA